MTYEETKYYFANPAIYLFPRSLKYLLKEEKKTKNGVETTEKKCELNDILSTYKVDNKYCFAGKYFKEIEKRVYLDLNNYNETNNEFTVIKKFCVGFLAKQGDTYKFTDKNGVYCPLDLKCESSDSNITAYLKYDNKDNSADPKTPISISLTQVENRIKEVSLVIKYSADSILSEKSNLTIYAKHANSNDWNKNNILELQLYRNNEKSLADFKQSFGKDTDFFILPRANPSDNQKKCIQQLKIINNQVFSRNKKFGDSFSFINETDNFIKDDDTFDKVSYTKLKNNIFNSINCFRTNDTNSSIGCRSNNVIGNFKTVYDFNFSSFGSNDKFIEYLSDNYGISINDLKGTVLDRNFLLGSCVSQNPYARYEGIVNLYSHVVVPFVNDFRNQLQSFLNHNVEYLSCPAYNKNYHRGPLTINNISKCLYVGESPTVKTLSSIFQGYTGNNNLPQNSVVEFFPGKDEHCFNTESENYYKISSVTIPNYGTKSFTESDNVYIKLSYENKKLCLDSNNACNRGNYTSSLEVTDPRDIVAINNYNNSGLPYFMFGAMEKWNNGQNQKYKKMTKEQLFSWNENADNWYSYENKPNTEYFGIDCSGLVVNCLLSIKDEPNRAIRFYSANSTGNELEVNATMMGGNDNCRQIPINITSDNETNTIIQKSDVVYVAGDHIGICDEGNILASFGNDYLSSEKRQDRYFNVIHNYGTENVRLSNDTLCTKSFFCKTIEGPANHWNLNTLNYSRIYLWN